MPATATARWLPGTDVSGPGEFGLFMEPQVAAADTGEAIAVWQQTQPNSKVRASVKAPGSGWGGAGDLSLPWEAREPRVAMNSRGQAVVIWRQLAEQSVIMAVEREPGGSWSTPTPISVPGPGFDQLDVAIDPGGNAVAVWTGMNVDEPGDYIVRAAVKPAGGAWAPEVELSAGGSNAWDPRVEIGPSGEAVATWYRWNEEGDTIVQAATKAPGSEWSEPEDLSPLSDSSSFARVATGDARTVVVWRRDGVIEGSTREPASSWSEPQTIAEPEAREPDVGIDANGNAVAVWTEGPAHDRGVASASLPAGGSTWSPPTRMTEEPNIAEPDPRVGVAPGGKTVAVWVSGDGEGPVIDALSGTTSGGWQVPAKISPPASWSTVPKVAIDGGGNAVAIWRSALGSPHVSTAILDVSPPVLSSVSIPVSGRAGRPLTFSAEAFDAWSPNVLVGWSLGEKRILAGPRVEFAYAKAGVHDVHLSAIDAANNPAPPISRTIEISPALAIADQTVPVRHGRARLTLRCEGPTVCSGNLNLVRRSKAKRRFSIGHSKFTVYGDVGSKTVVVKLNAKGRRLVRQKRRFRAGLAGTGVESRTVALRARSAKQGR